MKRELENSGQGIGNFRGITLVEMIVALAVIAVLFTVGAVNIGSWGKNAEYKAAARKMMNVLRETRSKAISSNVEHRVEIEITTRRYRITRGNRASGSNEWGTVVCDWQPFDANVATNVNPVYLNTNGTSNAGTISILNDAGVAAVKVTIATTGRVRISS